jgi:hypothetical protein
MLGYIIRLRKCFIWYGGREVGVLPKIEFVLPEIEFALSDIDFALPAEKILNRDLISTFDFDIRKL